MAADVVVLLLEVDFGGALLVAPSRPDGGTHRQEAAFGIFGAPAHLPAHGRFRQLLPGRAAAGCLTAPAQPFSLTFSLIYPHRRLIISCPGRCLRDVRDPRSSTDGREHRPDARRAERGASGRLFNSPDMGERPAIALASQFEGSRTIPMPRGPSLLACIAYLNPLSGAAGSAVDCCALHRPMAWVKCGV